MNEHGTDSGGVVNDARGTDAPPGTPLCCAPRRPVVGFSDVCGFLLGHAGPHEWEATFVAASEVEKKRDTRVFEVSDELAARSLLDWSEPVQLRLEKRDDGTYDLVCRSLPRTPEPGTGDSQDVVSAGGVS